MGLLDMFDQSGMDPKDRAALNQGLLSMGLSMMAGKGNLGQVVGQAGLQGMQSYQGARQRQQQDALNAMTMEQHQLALRQAKAQAEAQQRAQAFLQNLPGPQMQASQQALQGGGGPTVANAQRMPSVTADPHQQQLLEAVRAGALPLQTYLDATRKDTSPLTVKDNEVLLDRRTFQPLYSNRGEKDPKLPEGMRMGANGPEWIPGYLDGRRSVAQAGATMVSMGAPVAVTMPDGSPAMVQPGNRPGVAPQILRDPSTGQPLGPRAEAAKPIPDTAVRGMVENRAALTKIDKALGLVQQYPGAFGAQNYLGDTVQQRAHPQGVEARAVVADIGSLKIHDRSGAAVTVGEIARLKPFIPNATDTPQTIARKLQQFRAEYAQTLADMQEAYSPANGYRANSVAGSKSTGGAGGGLPAADAIAAELERRQRLGGR